MTDIEKEFQESIYRLAKRVKRGDLTDREKSQIIDAFNAAQGTAEERAVKAVEKVIVPIPWEQRRMPEFL